MLNTYTIFELVRISGAPKSAADQYLSVIMSDGENATGLRLGTPGIVLKHAFESTNNKDKLKILFPFPSVNAGMNPNYTCTIRKRHIIEYKNNILTGHIIRNLQQLHLNDGLPAGAMQGNWEAIKRHVDTIGPITFKIKSHNNNLTGMATLRFLEDLQTIVNSYKYNSVTFYNALDGYRNPTCMSYLVTFLGIRDCIPIFNPKRVDGVCVILTFISKSKITNTLNPIANATLLLSNYADNAFVIDGTWTNSPETLNSDTFGRLAKLVKVNIVAESKTKASKAKKKLSTPPKYENVGATSTSSSINSSTAHTAYYYSSSDNQY